MSWQPATPSLDSLVRQAVDANFSPLDLQTIKAFAVMGKNGPDLWASPAKVGIAISRTDRTVRRRLLRLLSAKIFVEAFRPMRWSGDKFIRPRTYRVHPEAATAIGNPQTFQRVDYEFRRRLRQKHKQESVRDQAREQQAVQAKAEKELRSQATKLDVNVQDFLRTFQRLMLGNISVPKSHPDYKPQLSADAALAIACHSHRIPQTFGRKLIDERRQHSEATVGMQFWSTEQKQGP
jgi:hypothetical protein